MRYITKITQIILVAFIVVLPFSSVALADAESACAPYTDTNQDKAVCQKGYDDPTGNVCAAITNVNQQGICKKASAQAATDAQAAGNGQNGNGGAGGTGTTAPKTGSCGGATTEIVTCDQGAGVGAIGSLIRTAVIILTVLIGVVAVGGIAYAAILYASAQNNQSQTQQAIGIIRNIVIGLVLYGFMVAIINWLIPGGVIG